ncbi:CatB-related O-acetyltransferase [Tepidibacter mesophilus]|uniref:CatB-related O-acetyltransferase n=1 Tax=Tepidibacter mesophilus TaxID=655607 RepID=UPI000C086628|nr:CatB-related O-acetyltransferase [Tepidibacter mesophilus]
MTDFKSWRDIEFVKDKIENPHIYVGEYTYYAGYYNFRTFEDTCVRYLDDEEDNCDNLIIGKFCSIASGVVFNLGGNQRHRKDWVTTYPLYQMFPDDCPENGFAPMGDTVVGNDVWIGSDALIMPGVTIGDGAIIAAKSVVTKNVEPYSIVAGVPAKQTSKRFSDEIIKALLEIKWWDFPIEYIKKLMPFLASNNIELMINKSNELLRELKQIS